MSQIRIQDGDICLADSASTHTILKHRRYFSCLEIKDSAGSVSTISGNAMIILGSGKASFSMPRGTKFEISDALYSPKSQRNLLSFRDIRKNGYHVETMNKNGIEYLCITSERKHVVEELPMLASGLYCTRITMTESYATINQRVTSTFKVWHERLGHPGSVMMRRIVQHSSGHPLKNERIFQSGEFPCNACSQGKLITRPSPAKVGNESPVFLERIHGDICGPIHPQCGPFRYFMVLIDASSRWSHVCLLTTRNTAFARFIAQIIRLRAQFPDYTIKKVRLDNAGEFTSKAFDDYCMAMGIDVEHPVPHVHTQNGMAENLIKRLQLIARPLMMRTKLPISVWGHAILHAAALVQLRPSAYNTYSPLQLASGQEPNISHLRVFGCAVYVPIAPPQRTKMGPQRRLGIYVGYTSPSIIRYLEPQTGDMFTARFADCHFDESEFPALGGGLRESPKDITWCTHSLAYLDPPTNQRELEVQKIIHMQSLANQLPDAFTDTNRVTKSYIPAANAPSRIEIPKEKIDGSNANEPKVQLKRGRPMGSKDKNPRKKKKLGENSEKVPVEPHHEKCQEDIYEKAPDEPDKEIRLEDEHETEKCEISINYAQDGKIWVRNEINDDDGIFSFSVSKELDNENDPEPRSVSECQKRPDWDKWQMAMRDELLSLNKRKVFGPVVITPKDVKPVGCKWVFVRKRNEKNEVTRYKARLVAQGFSQRPGIDYDETYSPVMDAITFRYLMSLTASKNLDMYLMDVVTAYLYGSLDSDIYMRIPEGVKIPGRSKFPEGSKDVCSVKLQRSLYGLKQSGRMWYNRLSEYLLKKGYINNAICPCVFIRKSSSGFVIIAVYVDDLNIIGTQKDVDDARNHMKEEFEMKDLGKTKFCLGLQIEHLQDGIFVHQSNYTTRVLKRFNMDKANPVSTPMVNRSLNIEKDPFRPCEDNEEVLGPEVPYMSAIGALMYLANCTRPDIAFATNLLARYSSAPTRRHWTGIKQIFRYLQGTIDLGLFYPRNSTFGLVGFADAGYLSDPHKARSQSGYVFTMGGTAISWRSQKQTLVATSSNHAEIIALHEACRECVWLRSMIHHIQESSGLDTGKEPTKLYEDNAACVAQLKEGYIKSDRTKHIPPRFFSYPKELEKNREVDIQYIRSSDNAADLFTKALPTSTFRKHIHNIGMRHLRDL